MIMIIHYSREGAIVKRLCIILSLFVILFVGCAKNNLKSEKFQRAKEAIQTYAEQNITAEWFSIIEPVGNIVVNDVQILKITPDTEDETARIDVSLKGYYTPMASTNESENKKFSLKKTFKVTHEGPESGAGFKVTLDSE